MGKKFPKKVNFAWANEALSKDAKNVVSSSESSAKKEPESHKENNNQPVNSSTEEVNNKPSKDKKSNNKDNNEEYENFTTPMLKTLIKRVRVLSAENEMKQYKFIEDVIKHGLTKYENR